jgi:hypothetical protein
MLRDKILDRLNKEQQKENKDYFPMELKGFVEVKAWDKGKLFYHDGGDNNVTIWARHSLMNLLSGWAYSNLGNAVGGGVTKYSRPVATVDQHNGTTGVNMDGNLLSGEQYFWDYTTFADCVEPNWPGVSPYFFTHSPTKVLFGTGHEFVDWAEFNADPDWPAFYPEYSDEPTFEGTSDCGIEDLYNYYSNKLNGSMKTLYPARTLSDISSAALPTADYSEDLGIDGAVKDCYAERIYSSQIYRKQNTSGQMVYNTSTDTINPLYRGLGRPAFVYCKRNGPLRSSSSEIYVSTDKSGNDAFENRITFTCVLPEQSGQSGAKRFYPYNEMTLKQIGLFNDSNFGFGTVPANIDAAGYQPYQCMPGGIMVAKRNITPITKTIDVRVSVSWTIYTT